LSLGTTCISQKSRKSWNQRKKSCGAGLKIKINKEFHSQGFGSTEKNHQKSITAIIIVIFVHFFFEISLVTVMLHPTSSIQKKIPEDLFVTNIIETSYNIFVTCELVILLHQRYSLR